MSKVYLDINIWDYIMKSDDVKMYFESLRKNLGWKYYLSVAHLEELHTSVLSETDKNKGVTYEQVKVMTGMSEPGVIREDSTGLNFYGGWNQFYLSFKTVFDNDTSEIVRKNAETLHKHEEEQRGKHNLSDRIPKNDDQAYIKVWDTPEIQELLHKKIAISFTDFYTSADDFFRMSYQFPDLKRQVDGLIKNGLLLANEKGKYTEERSDYYVVLSVISDLFDCLDRAGYNAGSLDRANSSEYDLQHAINATYCDVFITADRRFYEKYKAVAYYYGIPIKVLRYDVGGGKIFESIS